MIKFTGLLMSALLMMSPQTYASNLYHKLGGEEGIAQLMEEMLFNVSDDRRIRHHFAEADMIHVHRMLTEQICELTGGPCIYTGEDMVDSHTGLNITRSDFNALVEALQLAMDDLNIAVGTQNRLLSLLVPMHDDIVGL